MEAAGEPDDLEPAGVHLGQLERDLVGLGAGVEEDDLLEPGRQERDQALGEREHGFREHPRVQMDDLVERLADRGGDPRVVVAERRADLARGEVQHALPVFRLDPRPLGPLDDEGRKAAGIAKKEALAGVGHEESLAPAVSPSKPAKLRHTFVDRDFFSRLGGRG